MDEAQIEKLAKGLTKAQREAVCTAELDGERRFIRWWMAPNMDAREAKQLRKLGLGFAVWSGFCLGETGLAVRAHLLREVEA